jgi:ABC-type transport system involved in multi-copper enzyme maturation permease subunit
MKFLAILKDSLREAIDTKVFYVMVGLSLLITLIIFTVSFTPRSGERLMQTSAITMSKGMDNIPYEQLLVTALLHESTEYDAMGTEPIGGAPPGPESPHRVTVVHHSPDAAAAEAFRADLASAEERIKDRFGRIGELRLFTVTDVRPAPQGSAFVPERPVPTDAFFLVDVTPTPVARRMWPHDAYIFFGAVPLPTAFFMILSNRPLTDPSLGTEVFALEDGLVNGIGAWVAIVLSIIITAFFIPNMLRKGTVDLLVVKPIHRTTLLLYKYVGGLTFIFLNTAIIVVGMWLALGLRSGLWAPSFLLTIFIITAFFAILYSVSTLFGVLTRSPIAAILLTIGMWFLLFLVGQLFLYGELLRQQEERLEAAARQKQAQREADEPQVAAVGSENQPNKDKKRRPGEEPELPGHSNNWFFKTVRAVHFVLPRTKDLDVLTTRLLIRDVLTANQIRAQRIDDTNISWGESLTVSGLFVAVMLGLSCLRFATRDY